MTLFKLDAKLTADTHEIGNLQLSRLLLMDDARFPWVILVPRIDNARELIDLTIHDQHILLAEINQVGRALWQLLRPHKLNIATLGNVVAQLHIHIIARFNTDAAWPAPVWGMGTKVSYAHEASEARIHALRALLHCG